MKLPRARMDLLAFVVASVVAVVFALTVACGGNSQPAAATPAQDQRVDVSPRNPLYVAARTNLSLCVDGAGGYLADSTDVATVRNALDAGLAKHQNLPSEYASRSVTAGCPSSRIPLGQPTGSGSEYGKIVELPSEHFLFVYIIPADTYAETFPHQDTYAVGTAEKVCGGDVCHAATLGLFVPSTADSGVLENAILDALRLIPRTPNPEPVLDWDACARGEQPHPDYSCDQYEEWQRDQVK